MKTILSTLAGVSVCSVLILAKIPSQGIFQLVNIFIAAFFLSFGCLWWAEKRGKEE